MHISYVLKNEHCLTRYPNINIVFSLAETFVGVMNKRKIDVSIPLEV